MGRHSRLHTYPVYIHSFLTHWGRVKMAIILQAFSNLFSCMKTIVFRFKSRWRFKIAINKASNWSDATNTIMLCSLNLVPPHNLALNQPYCCQTITRTAYFTAHYDDVIMGAIASQITSLTTVYSTVYSGADQSKYQSCASLAFVWGIHRWPVNSPHKWPVTRKMFPFDDVIMICVPTSHSQSMLSFSRKMSLSAPPCGETESMLRRFESDKYTARLYIAII